MANNKRNRSSSKSPKEKGRLPDVGLSSTPEDSILGIQVAEFRLPPEGQHIVVSNWATGKPWNGTLVRMLRKKPQSMYRLPDLVKELRKLLFDERCHSVFTRSFNPTWPQVHVALDVLDDTQLAIDSYRNRPFPKNPARQVLLVYGLFQVLVVQQDAAGHLMTTLGMLGNPIQHKDLNEIRDIRNLAFGHPTKKDRKESTPKYTQTGEIRKDHLSVGISTASDAWPKWRKVNPMRLAKVQHTALLDAMRGLLRHLQERDQAHRNEFVGVSLLGTLGDLGDVAHVQGLSDDELADHCVAITRKAKQGVDSLIAEFQRRGLAEDSWGSVEDVVGQIRAVLSLMDNQAAPGEETDLEHRVAMAGGAQEVYGHLLMRRVEELTEAMWPTDRHQTAPRVPSCLNMDLAWAAGRYSTQPDEAFSEELFQRLETAIRQALGELGQSDEPGVPGLVRRLHSVEQVLRAIDEGSSQGLAKATILPLACEYLSDRWTELRHMADEIDESYRGQLDDHPD